MSLLRYRVVAAAVLLMGHLPILDAESLHDLSGGELYRQFCKVCHGASGYGDGVVSTALRTQPPDLTMIKKRNGGVFPTGRVYCIIDGRISFAEHGSREMPIWGWRFNDSDREAPPGHENNVDLIDRLVEYLRSIQR